MSDFNPYQAPSAHVQDSGSGSLELADRGTRLAAAILDSLIGIGPLAVAGVVAAVAVPGMTAARGHGDGATELLVLGVVGLLVVGWLLVALIWNLRWVDQYGQTIAKRILGIKMVRSDGSRLSAGRWFGMRVLIIGLLGAIPLLGGMIRLVDALLIFRENRKCLHDDIADTIVVKADA